MLTTFSAVITKSNTLHSFHVGDSRIHHLRGHMFEQITRDHTLTEGGREYLARALGADSHLEVDYHPRPGSGRPRPAHHRRGAWVLSRANLRELLAGGGADLEACARRIVDAAAQAGSDDNLTALIVSIDQLPLETLDRRTAASPNCRFRRCSPAATASTASKCWT